MNDYFLFLQFIVPSGFVSRLNSLFTFRKTAYSIKNPVTDGFLINFRNVPRNAWWSPEIFRVCLGKALATASRATPQMYEPKASPEIVRAKKYRWLMTSGGVPGGTHLPVIQAFM
jgi:hypothetical protein